MYLKRIVLALIILSSLNSYGQKTGKLSISPDGRYFTQANGDPFFLLGDTGWLLFGKLNREEAARYLDNRKQKGFNMIQVMVLHSLNVVNAYGDSALINKNVATPKTTLGASFSDTVQYDYWDHVDYIVNLAEERGLYMGMVPVWGSNVKSGWVSQQEGATYAKWLANRYKDKSNIVWLNGGDIKGSDSMNTWKAIGTNLRATDPNHLITFHPFGRTTSSEWFHTEPWLDFNMFQSGHKSYDLDTAAAEHKFGPDNYKFVLMDYAKTPIKPTLDGEPSYEEIPYGLHDTTKPRWNDNDVRRYGYWSVFAGGAGYTYGHNAVMQMRKPGETGAAYGSRFYWSDAIDHPGAGQLQYLKKLMLSKPYFDRVPDQSLVAGKQGEKYQYIAATRGKDYAFVYSYTGRNFEVNLGKTGGSKVKASWYNPRNGTSQPIGRFDNKGTKQFDPPGVEKEGNDWVLVLEK
ncbi:DUF4038 domain-containing protein [Segetibacter sp. 3557_3]|uniref:glycoside hydrolase family 140 protein n=1 Tax=Segetibacter sp. 3557_3 TaxID=2547429 RepID=UPI001058FCD4|nr:glycoside hydrolase family 140 protein [Segetibacter sp. 3557_3]TDH27448.1 DUF4038 domain-containing protein [Segetibacter sp. 3557_3]